MSRSLRLTLFALLLFPSSALAADQEWIRVSDDRKGFALTESGEPFVPWGFNYDHDEEGRLIEDYWEKEWAKVEEDFQEMKELGANVVRIHLQFGRFMETAEKPNQAALTRLDRLVALAEKSGLYLDLTGLCCYHKKDVPGWYDELDEQGRWDAQARFWEAVAGRCAKSPAIFCYDLMNEPVAPSGKRKDGDWLGPAFAGKHFVQFITLDQRKRPRHEIARSWVRHLVHAVRKHDKRHLVTVGLVDWSLDRPGLTSGFIPEKIAGDLDFLAVHIYPQTNKLDEALTTLKGFSVGKPVVIEETFPLKCSAEDLEKFIDRSNGSAAGWIGFYWGKTPDECRKSGTIPDAMMLSWLELFGKRMKEKSPQLLEMQSTTEPFLQNGVTAHRGNSGDRPENTLSAFQSGIDVGADWIELDIFRTKDGHLVVSHDRTTERVGDKNLSVPDSTHEDLLMVDVATDFRRRHGKTVEECPPQKMPLLEDVLRLVLKQNRTRVSIQPKMDCVAEAVALVKTMNAERWVGFNDGNLKLMAEVKRLAPKIPVFWDRGVDTNVDEDIRVANEHGFEALVLHHSGISSEKVRKIKTARIEVGVWTVNDQTTMQRLINMGVERIYTDHPRMLLALKAKGQIRPVECEDAYSHHLQGVCTDSKGSIYWCFTTQLVKTDLNGKALTKVAVANHHGDLCFHDGKVYVAVNLGEFNRPAGRADSWVYVYDAETLKELARHKTPEVVHGAGGIAFHEGRFLVVGGLPEGVKENYAYEYEPDFRFVRRHVLESRYTLMGIQTVAFADGHWWFGCYGDPKILLKADESLTKVERFEFDCSLGIVPAGQGRFLVGRGECSKEKGCMGKLVLAVAEKETGLSLQSTPTLDDFRKKLDKAVTPDRAVALFGRPDREPGSGLMIYEWRLDDGSKVRLGFPGLAKILYARHEKKDGTVEDLLPK